LHAPAGKHIRKSETRWKGAAPPKCQERNALAVGLFP